MCSEITSLLTHYMTDSPYLSFFLLWILIWASVAIISNLLKFVPTLIHGHPTQVIVKKN